MGGGRWGCEADAVGLSRRFFFAQNSTEEDGLCMAMTEEDLQVPFRFRDAARVAPAGGL